MANKRAREENMRLLHDALIYALNEKERRQFTIVLGEFQTRRNRENFVISLRKILNTSKKQEVVPYLIGILPHREREHFLDLWMRTSAYHSFYGIDDNNTYRSTNVNSRLSGRVGNNRPSSYINLIPQQKLQQERFGRKRQLRHQSMLQSKMKRSSPSIRPPSNLSKSRLSTSLPSLRSASQLDRQVKMHQITLKRNSRSIGFGFSIRGGAEHGLGIFVSSVDVGSVADRKNLSVGDQIVKLNEYNFKNITNAEAVQIIQQNKKLRMLVFSSSMVPGSRIAHVDYQWVDTNGRPSSPPLNFMKSENGFGRSRSIGDIHLLQDDDERRVVVHVQSGAHLGLRIRGGIEYGIGIFVSSVDPNQVAERSGIRAGDQIVDVNGVDFQEISHRDAVRTLKSYKMMSMLLRHVGKIPYARTVFEKTEWLDSARTSRSSSMISIAQDGRSSPSPERSKFRQGIAGSQLLHQSTIAVPAHKRIEEQARSVLNDKELTALKYYISQYIQGEIHVEGLVISLFHLFDSSTKISLINDVRTVIFPNELEAFDRLVLEKEVEAMKNLNRNSSANGIHMRVPSTSKSPKVPAKALSYKQLKSPIQQGNSKVPWSPPSGPLPSLPVPVNDFVPRAQEIIVHKEAPMIEDLDFEDDEEPGYEDDDTAITRNLEEDFVMEMFLENEPNSNVNWKTNDENDYEEIEQSMNDSNDHESSRSISSTVAQSNANDDQSNEAFKTSIAFNEQSPRVSNNAAVSHTTNDNADSDDIGISLMRSALLGFAGRTNHDETDSVTEEFEGNHAKEHFVMPLPNELDAKDLVNGTSNVVNEDIMALYARPDKSSRQKSTPNLDIYRPRIIPGEKLEEIPESAVSSPSTLRSPDFLSGDASHNHTEVKEDVIIVNETEQFFASPSMDESDGLEKLTENESNTSDLKDSPNKDINSLGSLVNSLQIAEKDDELSNETKWDDAMTLEELENVGEDIEFEYEDEPEIAETMLKDDDVLSLKFAPIKQQETAPSSPSVNQNHENLNKTETVKHEALRGNKAHSVNLYESDTTMPRSFGFLGLSSNNRRQRFNVQEISNPKPAGFDGFHSFSPKIMNSLNSNASPRTNDNGGYNSASVLQTGLSAGTMNTNSPVKTKQDMSIDIKSSDDNIIVFPDRNLTSKRIPVISYSAESPAKKHNNDKNDDDDDDMIRAKSADNSQADGEKGENFTFRNLRSIFEHQQQSSPRTEYLSEIIKKNNNEGRKRMQSLDENSNEVETNKIADKIRPDANIEDTFGVGNNQLNRRYCSKENSNLRTIENDLIDDFDFSSMISRQIISPSFNSQISDDKVENSSGYGSEDYSPSSENQPKTIRIEKNREELGILLERSKKERKGVQIKSIMAGEFYAACQYPQLQVGQEIVTIDGEPLQGLGPKIATISMNRAYNNPSGRFLEITVR